jgi:hypothetical protein
MLLKSVFPDKSYQPVIQYEHNYFLINYWKKKAIKSNFDKIETKWAIMPFYMKIWMLIKSFIYYKYALWFRPDLYRTIQKAYAEFKFSNS